MTVKKRLRFFLDECVPNSVGSVFLDSGHEVIYLREAGATGSPDPLVCKLAEENDAILVSLDSDMKKIAKGVGTTAARFARLSLVKLSCETVNAAERVSVALSLIEHEWDAGHQREGRRLYVEIGKHVIRTYR